MVEDLKHEIENIQVLKSFDAFEENDNIKEMIKLSDNKILVYSKSKTVKIFNPSNNYNCDFTAKLNTQNEIYKIISLQNEHLVITYDTPIFEIYSIHINEFKKEFSSTISCDNEILTSLTKNRFAIVDSNTKIKIFKGDVPYSETPIAELEGDFNGRICVTQVKDKEILAFAGNKVYLWDLNDYKCIKTFYFTATGFFIQLTDDIFASGGNLLDIQTGDNTLNQKKKSYYKLNILL